MGIDAWAIMGLSCAVGWMVGLGPVALAPRNYGPVNPLAVALGATAAVPGVLYGAAIASGPNWLVAFNTGGVMVAYLLVTLCAGRHFIEREGRV